MDLVPRFKYASPFALQLITRLDEFVQRMQRSNAFSSPLDRDFMQLNTKITVNDPVGHYLQLTKQVMPEMAASGLVNWPVRNDHCFQRIVLDAICGGIWYDHIARPAYKHLSAIQAERAVQLCENIISGAADIRALNRQSLIWRGKLK